MIYANARNAHALWAAASIALLGLTAQVHAVELLANTGFESPNTPGGEDTTAPPWVFSGTAMRANFFNHTAAPGSSRSIWFRTFEPLDSGVTQTVDIVPGGSYTFSAYEYFQDNWAASTDAVIQIGLTWRDAANNLIGTPSFTNITDATNPPVNTWTQFSVSGVAPAGAAKVDAFLGWTNGGGSGPNLSVFADDASLQGPGVAPQSTWNVNGGGDWNNSDNWFNLQAPNAVDATANFFGVITAPHTVYSDIGVTVGSLNFNNASTYVIAGAGSLTMQRSTGSAQVTVTTGTQKINLPLMIASNTVLNVASGGTLLISDPVTVGAGKSLTPSGAGQVIYQSTVTVQTGGSLVMGNSTHAASLALQGSSTASMSAHAGSTQNQLWVDGLSIDNGSSLDLTNNALLTNTTESNMRTLLLSGKITTSLAAGGHAIGYAAQGASGQVLARYTWSGDTNLDGQVNIVDLGALAGHWQQSGVWTFGDINYDGTVNIVDLGLLAGNWQKGVGNPLGEPSFEAALASLGLPNVSVPEPASLGLAFVFGAGVLARRRAR